MPLGAAAHVPDLRLDLVGDTATGAYRDGVYALIRSHRLETRVGIPCARGDRAPPRRYADADVFALPTEREGYGIVFAEALMHGLPIVAADIAPVRAIVGDAGVFVPPQRARPLAAALRLMTMWSTRRAQPVLMSCNGREKKSTAAGR